MIAEWLNLFNQDSKEFKNLVYDPDGIESDPINAIQDINKGAIHNSFEYTNRWKERLIKLERNLKNSTGIVLDAIGKEIFGINRNSDNDTTYRDYIKSLVFPDRLTLNFIKNTINNSLFIKESSEVGFFLDDSFLDDPPDQEGSGSILTAKSNSIYLLFFQASDIDWDIISYLNRIRDAGIAIYVSWIY
ncbi:MAG: hypothetical protein KDK36_06610 [Leptospiraceae bacterium]|nr:hypothetical protein [Leptospiraceae bacterium]